MTRFDFEAIGTAWQIDIYQDLSVEAKDSIFSQIQNRIEIFDKTYSRFRADSLVTLMSKNTGTFELPLDAKYLFEVYHDLYTRTNGLFTPLVGNILSDAGYDASYSLTQKKELETPPAWDEVLEYTHPSLVIKKPMILDFGAGGKGYLVDLVARVLEENQMNEYCIDAGGDILYKHKNNQVIRIGLENPDKTDQVIGVYPLTHGSICGSAGNRRAWGTFNHIVNPKTLASAKEILAVWVIAETAFIADALATCLFFVDASALSDAYTFEYILIRKDHSVETSKNFSGEIFHN
jgi:thiamine biosynthesis lipoprotein